MDETSVTRGERFVEVQASCSAFLRDLTLHIATLQPTDAG
jgi:hypothetical protein